MARKSVDGDVLEVIGGRSHFILGDVACAYGAVAAGCRFFAGYPITPASEIAERMSEILPRLGGNFLQMEDEIASIASVIGASWTGCKAMTATSGPGFSLMQENIGYAVMTETPVVLVDVQRVGPSTGMPTLPSQGDTMQARWGTHGDHQIIALAPADVQEAFDLTVEAFNLSEKYRIPVIFLMDARIGHMREKLEVPPEIEIIDRIPATIDVQHYKPFRAGYTHPGSKVPEMDRIGDEYPTFVTGLSHDEMGYPRTTDPETYRKLIGRLEDKIIDNMDDVCMSEEYRIEDAEIAVLSYGLPSRACRAAVERAREEGIEAGHIKLITIWPFDRGKIEEIAERVEKILVVEMNRGQLVREVREAVACRCDVEFYSKTGGDIITPSEVLERLREV